MQQSQIIIFVLLAVTVLIILSIIVIYNSLVALRNQVKNAWSQIDVQLKRRHDLIPNLVETVKGYAEHEKSTLEEVINARQQAVNIDSEDFQNRVVAENALSGALKSLFAVSENYPDLKANQNFMQLHEEIASTENKISFARQFYNDSVLNYNNKKEMFPSNIIAGIFNFERKEFFEIEANEKEIPKVKF